MGPLFCLSVLSATLVYCGQTVGWITMKLGMEVRLGPGHIVLDGDPSSPERGSAALPSFRPMSIVAKVNRSSTAMRPKKLFVECSLIYCALM